jgi:hypothetical protein
VLVGNSIRHDIKHKPPKVPLPRQLQLDRRVIRLQIKQDMPSRPPSAASLRDNGCQTAMSDYEENKKEQTRNNNKY